MANLSKVIYINEEDYSTLLNGGTITKGGVTYSHDPTALYVIKNVSAPEYAETAGYATTAGQATKATQDGGGNVISETYAKKAVIGTLTISNDVWSCDKTHKELTNAILAGNLVYLTAPNWSNQAYYPKKYPYPDGNGNYNRDLQFQSLESQGYCERFDIHDDNSIENEEIDFEAYLSEDGRFKQRIILKLTIGNSNTLSFKDQDNQNIEISGANWLIRYSQDERDVVIQYNNREYRKQTYESDNSCITFVSIDLEDYLLYYLSFNCSTTNTVTLIENTFIPILSENAGFGQAYGISSDNKNSAVRTSSIPGFELKEGGIVAIKFTTDVDITDPNLNISSTGAKSIYYRGSAPPRGTINAGDTVTFIYDGTYYHMISIDRDIPTKTSDLTNDNGFINKAMYYGNCPTAALFPTKLCTVETFPTYTDNGVTHANTGTIIAVKFSNTDNSGGGAQTLNVNNIGAKSIIYNNTIITTSMRNIPAVGIANTIIYYRYDSSLDEGNGAWEYLGKSVDSDSTYSNASLGQGYGTQTNGSAATAITASISSYDLTIGGIVSIKFTYDVPASATLNINSNGAKAIYNKGAAITAGIIKGGDIATFIYDGTHYQLLSVDSWQDKATAPIELFRWFYVDNFPNGLPESEENARVLTQTEASALEEAAAYPYYAWTMLGAPAFFDLESYENQGFYEWYSSINTVVYELSIYKTQDNKYWYNYRTKQLLTSTDISAWAKASTKPSYSANEISGLTNDIVDISDGTANDGAVVFTRRSGDTVTLNFNHTHSQYALASSLSAVATSGEYSDLLNKPTIPTETTVSGWGFTKNTGTITGITMNGASKGTSGVVNLGNVVTSLDGCVQSSSVTNIVMCQNQAAYDAISPKDSATLYLIAET